MLDIVQTSLFRKQLKRCKKRGLDLSELSQVVGMLQNREKLPTKYRDHALTGDRLGQRDCHINPDWILIYRIREDILILELLETGSHSDLGI